LGSYRYNNSGSPVCVAVCPEGYADDNTRICLDVCPILHRTFGLHNTTTGTRVCVLRCPSTHYADPDPATRTCLTLCPNSPLLYGFNATR